MFFLDLQAENCADIKKKPHHHQQQKKRLGKIKNYTNHWHFIAEFSENVNYMEKF